MGGVTVNVHDATELAYTRGYEDGKRDAAKSGHWITKNGITFCSECMTCGLPFWKRCPVCEAKMDLPRITDQTQAALEKMGRKAHVEE